MPAGMPFLVVGEKLLHTYQKERDGEKGYEETVFEAD
jgi:hypothetical protein